VCRVCAYDKTTSCPAWCAKHCPVAIINVYDLVDCHACAKGDTQ
jgi:hypothetical protein